MVISDMLGLIVVLIFIIVGFSLVFFDFNRNEDFSIHLYSTYKLLFGDFEDHQFSLSQKLLLSFMLFILNIAVISLIISIIKDSYDRTQEKKVLTDSLTRLDMLQEIMILMRTIRPKPIQEKGHLTICKVQTREGEELSAGEWEGKDNIIKKLHKQADMKRERDTVKIINNIAKTREQSVQNSEDVKHEINQMMREIAKAKQETKKDISTLEQRFNKMEVDAMKNRLEMKRQMNNLKHEIKELSTGQQELLNLVRALHSNR